MKIIADTNTFLAVVLNEPEKKQIVTLTVGHELAAPKILPFEIGNALSAMVKRGRLSKIEAMTAFEETMQIPVELRDIVIMNALDIACRNKIYAYGAYFLECALSLRGPLLTLDGRMKETARAVGVKLWEVQQ